MISGASGPRVSIIESPNSAIVMIDFFVCFVLILVRIGPILVCMPKTAGIAVGVGVINVPKDVRNFIGEIIVSVAKTVVTKNDKKFMDYFYDTVLRRKNNTVDPIYGRFVSFAVTVLALK